MYDIVGPPLFEHLFQFNLKSGQLSAIIQINEAHLFIIKTHGSVSCGPRSRRVTPVSILTGRKKTQFSHLRSSVLP